MNSEYFLNYITHQKRYSVNTHEAYRRDLEDYTKFLRTAYEVTNLSEASHIMIRDYILFQLENGIVVSSVKRRISTLKSFYKFLLKEEVISSNPTSRIIAPKSPKLLPNYVKEDEMSELLSPQNFTDDFIGQRDKLILELFYQTGMRVSELVELKVGSLNFGTQSLKVLGKRNKERIIPLSKQLIHEVDVYQKSKKTNFPDLPDTFLMVSDKGGKLNRKFVYDKVKHYLSQVSSLKKKSPHVIRHTFATHMLKNGADLNAIKEILGHASLAATQVYAHNNLEQLKASHKKAHPRN